VGRRLGRLFAAGSAVGLSDGELLDRFAQRRDESAAMAFETILARHGALVLTVCRQVLGDEHAAEDAFQATFIVLLRRAGSLRLAKPDSLGPWLYGVAYRIALKARRGEARRQARERRAAVPEFEPSAAAIEDAELRALVHDEVNRLPAKYRAPVVLCYYEGRTHDEAAAAVNWPVGTVRGRLARARDLLRSRLTRRARAPGAWIGTALLEPIARMEPRPRLLETTVTAVFEGKAAKTVVAMVNVMLKGLLLTRLKLTVCVTLIPVILTGLALRGAPAPQVPVRSDLPPAPNTVGVPQSPATPNNRSAEPLPEHARVRLGSSRFNHGDAIQQAIYTPDGKSLVALGAFTTGIRVWDAATGQMVRAIGGPPTRFSRFAISPDSQTLATIEEPGLLRTWGLASGRVRRSWHSLSGLYQWLAFSPDGRTVAAGFRISDRASNRLEQTIDLWDITAPTERRRRIAGDWHRLSGLVFSPDGKTLITGSYDTEPRVAGAKPDENPQAKPDKGSIRLWDLATGAERTRFSIDGSYVLAIAISPDGKLLAAALTDASIRVYDLTTGREHALRLGQDDVRRFMQEREEADALKPARPALAKARLARGPIMMQCLAFSRDGSILATGLSSPMSTRSSSRAVIYLWDVGARTELRHFAAHQRWVQSLSFSPDGQTLASTGPEPMIRLWDVTTGREAAPSPGHHASIHRLLVSPADGTVFTAGKDGTIRQWDPDSGRELGIAGSFARIPELLAIAPDGKTLLIVPRQGGPFALWNIAERREIRTLPRDERRPQRYEYAGAFAPDGKTVAYSKQVWDAATGRVLVAFIDADQRQNIDPSFYRTFYSSDGTQLITAEPSGVKIRDAATGQRARWAVLAQIQYRVVALSPDGRFLASGGFVNRSNAKRGDPSIHLWELASGKEVATFVGHEMDTRGLSFSPDGRWLASCSGDLQPRDYDATVRVWDVATARELGRFEGHRGPVNAVAFTPDGRSVVSASDDATALVWDVSDLAGAPKTAEPMTAEAMKTRWDELAGNDARNAYRATWSLSVPSSVPFLRGQLRPAAAPDPEGFPAARGPIAPPDVLRTLRATAALERIGTPEARAVLERMAQGNPGALATRDAKSANDRLAKSRRTASP
jgi:RNA polymerase sigma factor (sigma-70 family)